MPRHFTETERSQFVHHCTILKHTVDHTMECLYGYLPPWERPKRKTLVGIWTKLNNMNYEQICEYESPHSYRHGPDKKLAEGSDLTNFIDHTLEGHRTIRLRAMIEKIMHDYFGGEDDSEMPSKSTINSHILANNTRKKTEYHNIRADPVEQVQFLRNIAVEDYRMLWDIDAMLHEDDDFRTDKGYAPKGHKVLVPQITIGGKSYPVYACYSVKGFVDWIVFPANSTMTEEEVGAFIKRLKSKKEDGQVGLFDNAANQRTLYVRDIMRDTFNGLYYYCAAYSPWLKPIERGFSNVKRHIQSLDHVLKWKDDPEGLIEHAFHQYSKYGPWSSHAEGHFNLYKENSENLE